MNKTEHRLGIIIKEQSGDARYPIITVEALIKNKRKRKRIQRRKIKMKKSELTVKVLKVTIFYSVNGIEAIYNESTKGCQRHK